MNPTSVKNPKSALTAGVLAILLGFFGLHDWYLSNRKKAKSHVILAILAIICLVLSTILQVFLRSGIAFHVTIAGLMSSFATIFRLIGWVLVVVNEGWAIFEGILLLVQGDSGLAEQGYTTNPKTPDPAQTPSTATPSSPAPTSMTNNQTASDFRAPTLAEQAAGASAQPITFRSKDIRQPNPSSPPNQPLSTQDVETPPLTVKDTAGKITVNPTILRRVLIIVGAIVAIIVVTIIFKTNFDATFISGYRDAYHIASEIRPSLTTAAKSSSCQYTIDYVKTAYVDRKTYNGYVETCKNLVTEDATLVTKLGETGAMQLNSEISTQYKDFKQLYDETLINNDQNDQMIKALDLYQAWHDYELATDTLTVDSPASDFQYAADILRKSGNERLAQYGEEWYHKQLDYINAYHTYWDTSYTDPQKETLRVELETKRQDLQAWVEDHRPDVISIASFAVPNLTPMYESFEKLYNLIRVGYQDHYDYSSNDCNEAGKKVYCN